jgi:AcrR family transcriptional regulator
MKQPDAYHHGNLRQALLDGARALIGEMGVEALTLRAVARRVGVTTAAPYHHFADKAALVHALARESLEELDRVFQAALAGIDEPQEQLRALGVAYLLYAVEHPADFRLMFRPELGAPLDFKDPASAPVFRILIDVVSACRAAAGVTDKERDTAAIAAWSLVHGLAALLVDGPLFPLAANRDALRALCIAITDRLTVT